MPPLASCHNQTATWTGPGVVKASVPGRTPFSSVRPRVLIDAVGPRRLRRWRTEDPERILDDLAAGLVGSVYERQVDRRAAIRLALETAKGGDTVVLAGKGHETYQVLGNEKRPFDERVVVRECLQELGA